MALKAEPRRFVLDLREHPHRDRASQGGIASLLLNDTHRANGQQAYPSIERCIEAQHLEQLITKTELIRQPGLELHVVPASEEFLQRLAHEPRIDRHEIRRRDLFALLGAGQNGQQQAKGKHETPHHGANTPRSASGSKGLTPRMGWTRTTSASTATQSPRLKISSASARFTAASGSLR